jgi:hypothetical protein
MTMHGVADDAADHEPHACGFEGPRVAEEQMDHERRRTTPATVA